jgi:integrase
MARRGDGISLRGKTWYLDFIHQGKRHYIRLGKLISRSVARELAIAARTRILRGEVGLGGPPAITVAAYATKWLRAMETRVEPKTLRGYTQLLHCYILPVVGKQNLGALDRKAVRALLAAQERREMSKNTVRLIRATLSAMCTDAIEDEYLLVNPAQGLGRKGRRGPGTITPADREKEIRPLSVEQLAQLLAEADTGPDHESYPYEGLLFRLMSGTGLRPAEAVAPRWDEFDAAARVVKVTRSFSDGVVKPTKTKRRRIVDLGPTLLALLDTRQGLLEAEAGLAGREPSEWIFPGPDRQPLDVVAVARRFRLLCRRAGLPRFRLYDLRHTYATHALARGVPIPYISKQMGHASPKITMEIYAHWIDDGDSSWATKIEEYQLGLAPDAEPRPNPRRAHVSRPVDGGETTK